VTTQPAAGDTHGDPLVTVIAGELEGHQIEWVDDEVGYECGCNEDGHLGSLLWLRDALRHQAAAVVAALRPHIDAQKQAATTQALRDAADRIDEHPDVCLSGYRVSNEHDMDSDCSHCIAFDLRAAADGGRPPTNPAVPRCRYVSPSPWGPTQCALPDDHDGRHAYSPSESINPADDT